VKVLYLKSPNKIVTQRQHSLKYLL